MKIFIHPFHENHLFDLTTALKEHQFFMLDTFYKQLKRKFPNNVKKVSHYIDCDVAILNMDHQFFRRLSKTRMVKELNEVIPKNTKRVWIINSIPVKNGIDHKTKNKMLEYIGNSQIVVNSYESVKIYGKGTVIHHGIEGFKPRKKEPRVVTFVSPIAEAYEYYDHDFLQEVREELRQKYEINHVWLTVDKEFKDYKEYKKYLEETLIYFHPSKHSPMPRTRTEAMLSGCCVVTTPHHDAKTFIKNGENGFLINRNPEVVAKLIYKLLTEHYKLAVKIGENGRKTALKKFNYKNYKEKWEKLIFDIKN